MRALLVLFLLGVLTLMQPAPLALSSSVSRSELRPGDRFTVVVVVTTDGAENERTVTVDTASLIQDRLELVVKGASAGAFEGLAWSGAVNAANPVLLWYTFRVPEDLPAGGSFYKLIWSAHDDYGRWRYAANVVRVGQVAWAPPDTPGLQVYFPVFRG